MNTITSSFVSKARAQETFVVSPTAQDAGKEIAEHENLADVYEEKKSDSELNHLQENLRNSRKNAFNSLLDLKTALKEGGDADLQTAFESCSENSREKELKREMVKKGKTSHELAGRNADIKISGEEARAEVMRALDDCIDRLEYQTFHDESYDVTPDTKSDKELQEEIQKLIEEMERDFRNPFLSAAEQMTAYYRMVASLRDIVSQNIYTKGPDYIEVRSTMFSMFDNVLNTVKAQPQSLYPPGNFTSTNKEDCEAWCKKMGVGIVVESPVGSGMYKVRVDTTGLESFIATARQTITNGNDATEHRCRPVVFNSFMAALDNFLQQENTKTSKLTNQLEYYSKLLDNVRQTINQFFKDMCKLAETIFSNGR